MNVSSRVSAAVSSAAKPQLLRFEDGHVLYEEGSEAFCWYEVEEGVVRTCRYFPDGDRHVVGFFFQGDCFGLDPGEREENAEAVTPVKLWRRLHGDLSSSAGGIHSVIGTALHATQARLYLLGRRTAEQRLAAFLLSLAERLGRDGLVPVPMSRIDIADHLRLTVHTVSRTMSRLSERNIIGFKTPQAFRIIDGEGLSALAARRQARV